MTLHPGPVDVGTALAARLAATAQATSSAGVNRLDFRASAAAQDQQLLADLLNAPADGHATRLHFAAGSWSFTVNADPQSAPVLDVSGETSDVLSGSDLADFEDAVTRNDAAEATRLAAAVATVDVQLTVHNNPSVSGFHWIRSVRDLRDLLSGSRWVTTLNALATGPTHLVIDDAGDAHLRTDMLNITGPLVTSPAAPPMQMRTVGGSVGNFSVRVPDPHLTSRPVSVHEMSGQLFSLASVLQSATRRLAWTRMATDASLAPDGALTLTIAGARDVQVRLAPSAPASDAAVDIDLYEWTFGSDELARYDATVHAASLAILHDSDLDTAAGPTLRTARSVYRMSKAGAVAEAMATRRAAREAVQDAAKAAANTARDASAKATERCLVQAGAAVAVVLTNGGDLIDESSGYLLIGLIALLGVVSLLIALCVELKSARDALAGGLQDLDEYQEAIPLSEITAMRDRSAARSAAESDLKRAKIWTSIVYGVTTLAVAIVGGVLIYSHASSMSPGPVKPHAATELSAPPSNTRRMANVSTDAQRERKDDSAAGLARRCKTHRPQRIVRGHPRLAAPH